jgi:antitoxin PrlF
MKAAEAKITSKGQVTVPAALRKALGVKTGDKLVFTQDAQGRFLVGRQDCDPIEPVDRARIPNWIATSRSARWNRTDDAPEDDEA